MKHMLQVSSFKFHEKGFTLIEAVVAVSVFAVATTSIVGVYLAVQRLTAQSAALQAVQQNGRFITEDLTKTIRNGQIDYARYGGSIPQPATTNLYLLDRDGVPIRIFQSGNDLILDRAGVGSTNFTSREVRVRDFKVYIWPAVNPFPGGAEQPTATVFLELESNINPRDKLRVPFQTTAATRQYPE